MNTTTQNTPSLRTLNFQYAALKRIADTVKEGMAYIKDQHLAALQADHENSNATKWDVTGDEGEKIATVTLAGGKSKPVITSESALIEWAQQNRPDMVESRPRLTEQAKGTLAALIETYVDGTPITEDGEPIPGVEEGHGSVYQSLRFTSTKQVDGKRVMDDFITELGLAGLIEDVATQSGGDR
ncbi:MAG: hypothetical protein L0G94_14090 [Brachybacterium sp.]|uniref:hypothetical protein n=1 Tax=Brachybacterium sp. TaxID=1891286 RepID=UPI00264707E9|nr:hypothetical protein [Brachybacterium sp.]MDN5687783.1 hypothetical protein [Brachybacterium sp.]